MLVLFARRMVFVAALSIVSSSIACASVGVTSGIASGMSIGPGFGAALAEAVDRGARSKPEIRLAQDTSKVSIKVLIDSKQNRDYVKADDQFPSFVYEAVPAGDTVKIQPASKLIMDMWKGNATIEDQPFGGKADIEDTAQFAPVFIVAEVRNDGTRAVQVTSAYLDITDSATDFQPLLAMSQVGRVICGNGNYIPDFEMLNFGWGAVQNGKLAYSFVAKSLRSSQFTADLGTFDHQVTATVDEAVRKQGVDVAKLSDGTFKCSSRSQVPACLARLKSTGIFGELANYVYTSGNMVATRVEGDIQYDWVDSRKATQQRSSPFAVTIPLLFFDVGGAECGAPGPVERPSKPIALSLDRQNYRVPLPFKGPVASRQVSRFGLTLTAEKASHHALKVVLSLADGTTISSGPVDVTYFTPRMPPPPADEPEDKK
jgi:hypothetical protein